MARFWSPGEIASHLKLSYFAVARLIRKLGIAEVSRAGNTRLFSAADVRRMAADVAKRGAAK
jgi:hypothetical protein